MTPKEQAAMQQALEALVEADKYYDYDAIITALREALEQQKPEVSPDGLVAKTVFTQEDMAKWYEEGRKHGRSEALEQPEQQGEAVAVVVLLTDYDSFGPSLSNRKSIVPYKPISNLDVGTKLYTTQQKREAILEEAADAVRFADNGTEAAEIIRGLK